MPEALPWLARPLLLATGVLALRREDYLLSAFPRSGSTWTRHVLCNIISLAEWDGRDVEAELDATMPALGASNLFKRWTHPTLPRVVKTHLPYVPVFRRVPSIGLVRDPRDVMVSRYHLVVDKRHESSTSFARFIRDRDSGLERWFRHHASWRDHWRIVLRYEDMLRDPEREFGRLLEVLGAPCPRDRLREALDRSAFRRLQQAERRRQPTADERGLFFRSGSSGQWTRYFSIEDLAYLEQLAERYDVVLDGADAA